MLLERSIPKAVQNVVVGQETPMSSPTGVVSELGTVSALNVLVPDCL